MVIKVFQGRGAHAEDMFDVWCCGGWGEFGECGQVCFEEVDEIAAEGFGIHVSVEPAFL